MMKAAFTGREYVNTHRTAFTQHAEGQWEAAMRNISPTLVRAIRLKLLSLRLNDRGRHTDPQHVEPEVILAREAGELLAGKAEAARLDMNAEPLLSEIGIYRPALTGVDMRLFNSPAAIHKLVHERKAKLERKQKKESQA
ncbi:hypothetical protein AAGQ96_16265 [Pantoea sp. MBD-2R]|uniref:hypothetical protein n=1 Tax=Pantoea sp. MBD-2R TaxID=3141540 RepID=UPI0031840C99